MVRENRPQKLDYTHDIDLIGALTFISYYLLIILTYERNSFNGIIMIPILLDMGLFADVKQNDMY